MLAKGERAQYYDCTKLDEKPLSRIIGKELAKLFAKKVQVEELYNKAQEKFDNMKWYAEEFEKTLKEVPGCENTSSGFTLYRILTKAREILTKAEEEK